MKFRLNSIARRVALAVMAAFSLLIGGTASAVTIGGPLLLTGDQLTGVDEVFQTVTFSRAFDVGVTPVVVPLLDGTDTSATALRIRNVTNAGFEIAQLDHTGNNGTTVPATVNYLAGAPGNFSIDGIAFEIGTHSTTTTRGGGAGFNSTGGFDTVNFNQSFSSTPAILSFVQTMENEASIVGNNATADPSSPWLQTAVDSANTSSFNLALERAEVSDGLTNDIDERINVPETIGYIAIEEGTGSIETISGGDILFESFIGDSFRDRADGDTDAFSQTFTSPPLVAGSQMTVNGGDGAWLRFESITATEIGAFVQEDTFTEGELNHAAELAGLFAFSQSFAFPEVPEPSSFALLGLGLCGLMRRRRR